MGADQEIEGLLDGIDIIRKDEGGSRYGRWAQKILPWVAVPSIFLLGMATSWLLITSQCRPYHDTSTFFQTNSVVSLNSAQQEAMHKLYPQRHSTNTQT